MTAPSWDRGDLWWEQVSDQMMTPSHGVQGDLIWIHILAVLTDCQLSLLQLQQLRLVCCRTLPGRCSVILTLICLEILSPGPQRLLHPSPGLLPGVLHCGRASLCPRPRRAQQPPSPRRCPG